MIHFHLGVVGDEYVGTSTAIVELAVFGTGHVFTEGTDFVEDGFVVCNVAMGIGDILSVDEYGNSGQVFSGRVGGESGAYEFVFHDGLDSG